MTKITTILAAIGFGIAMAPQAVAADSIIRREAHASDFHKFLPALPADVPWLTPSPAPSVKSTALPEAGSVSAWMFIPTPAEAWGSLKSQPVALRSAAGCKRC